MEVKKRGEIAIGIELGLNTSCVAVWRHENKAEVIPNDMGNHTTPSYVAFSETRCFVGDAAKNQADFNPSNTIFDSMKLIGKQFNNHDVQKFINHHPFKVVPNLGSQNGKKPMIVVSYKGEKKEFQAEDISAMILRKLKEDAEAYLGTELKNVVITVPAYFNDLQRQETRNAGVIAGLNVMHIISEPVAAAMAYGVNKNFTSVGKNVLVFNLGRETCEISLVNINKDAFEVKSSSEDKSLGDQNFDNRLVTYFVDVIKRKHGKNIRQNPRAINKLRVACEKAKVNLSSRSETAVDIDRLFHGIDFHSSLSRMLFDKLNYNLLEQFLTLVDECLKGAKLQKEDVHEVVLVGGGSRIPMIQQMLGTFFQNKVELCSSIHPDEVVACGAAVHAAEILSKNPTDRVDTTKSTNIPLLFKEVDSLLKGFSSSKPIKPFPLHMKFTVMQLLSQLKLDFSNAQLVQNLSLVLREFESSLPEHLHSALRGLEQTLVACQHHLFQRVSEKKATFINPREIDSANSALATSKKMVQSKSSYCDRLKADIADTNASIACLMEKKTRLERDLDSAQLNLVDLTATLATQMQSAQKRLKKANSFREAEKLECKARQLLVVAIDCLDNFFASL